ncbi:MAG: hypothetical protein IKD46_04025, partial [Lentisphaeria bacterium]|nr:hypothetical protein [Lentisphaeria bacterium]
MSAGKIRLCSFGILLLALCWNFFRVYQLAVDVPVGDDWDLLKNVTSRQWNDLAEVHVQHRIIFTRLLLHLAWVWDALDYRSLIFCNYFTLYSSGKIGVSPLPRPASSASRVFLMTMRPSG